MTKKPSVHISSLTFSDGQTLSFNENDKIVIVGPNNGGKSQTLRDIMAFVRCDTEYRGVVVKKLELKKLGTEEELRLFFEGNAELLNGEFRFHDSQMHSSQLGFWNHFGLNAGLHKFFFKNITADERLTICQPQPSLKFGAAMTNAQHMLRADPDLMKSVSELFQQAFGKELMFDYSGGAELLIHVGQVPPWDAINDRISNPYNRAVSLQPLLVAQGDGMKSYAGILFEAIVNIRDVTLIDEPEAFLHPPQMRRLGDTLSKKVTGQLVVSTHSTDILRGFLEGSEGNVRILRIQRENDINTVTESSLGAIKELWEKPVLRYSNALEGVFHEQAIICEDESDCRLFNAVGDYVSGLSDGNWLDTAFVPAGGKSGVPKLAGVLRQIGVPVKAVFDMDFLNDRALVKETVSAMGGSWDDFESLWSRVDAAVRKGKAAKTVPEIKEEIISLLQDPKIDGLPKGDVIEAMKQDKQWNEVKHLGASAIPKGDATRDYNSLVSRLMEQGIYLVPVGEIENFCREIGSHGTKHVTKLLSEIKLSDTKLSELRSFVKMIYEGSHCKMVVAATVASTH